MKRLSQASVRKLILLSKIVESAAEYAAEGGKFRSHHLHNVLLDLRNQTTETINQIEVELNDQPPSQN